MKGTVFIVFALLIDLLQAGVSWGLFAITSTGGTLAGGAGGCYAGSLLAGKIGCWIGGATLAFFGTFLNAPLAAELIPIGAVLGFAFSICVSLTLGAALVTGLMMTGMFHGRYALGPLSEIVPGINTIPSWTVMTILCVLHSKAAKDGHASSTAAAFAAVVSPNTSMGKAYRSIAGIQRQNARTMMNTDVLSQTQYRAARVETRQDLKVNLKNIDGIRPQPTLPDTRAYAQA